MSTAPQRPVAPQTPQNPQVNKTFKTSTIQKYPPAPMMKRFIALVLDSIIGGVGAQLISAVILKVIKPDPLMSMVYGIVLSMILGWGYWIYFPLKLKGTPGKKLMGLRIVTEKHSRQLTLGQMIKRETIGRFLSTIVLGVGYLSAIGDKKERRTWHDRIAKTRVIEYR